MQIDAVLESNCNKMSQGENNVQSYRGSNPGLSDYRSDALKTTAVTNGLLIDMF